MDRYYYTDTITKDNKLRYVSSIFPDISVTNDDIYIIANETDRYDLLSQKYYGDSTLWWLLALANNHNKPTLYIEPGKQIRIPRNIMSYLDSYKKLNQI